MTPRNAILGSVVSVSCLMLVASGCAQSGQFQSYAPDSTTPATSKRHNTMTTDSLFEKVPLGTSDQNICSPADPGIYWRGVLLRAPLKFALPENMAQHTEFVVPICGLYLVNAADTVRHPGPLVLVVTDNASGETYKGEIVKEDPNLTSPQPRSRSPKPSSKQAFGSYFNLNVAAYVRLPSFCLLSRKGRVRGISVK